MHRAAVTEDIGSGLTLSDGDSLQLILLRNICASVSDHEDRESISTGVSHQLHPSNGNRANESLMDTVPSNVLYCCAFHSSTCCPHPKQRKHSDVGSEDQDAEGSMTPLPTKVTKLTRCAGELTF